MGSRSETKNQNTSFWIAKTWDRTRPIVAIQVGATLLATDALTILDKAGAAAATHHLAFKNLQGIPIHDPYFNLFCRYASAGIPILRLFALTLCLRLTGSAQSALEFQCACWF